jgi:hypothetical protein
MARITISEARKICTQAELGLLMACRPKAIEKLTVDELKSAVTNARRLRNKWRDVATEQRRTTQRRQKARTTDANARSGEKAAIFADALKKFEGQLKVAEAGGGPTKPAKRTGEKKPSKAERGQSHREVRAIARGYLKAAKHEMNVSAGTAKGTKKKAAKKPAAIATTGASTTGTAQKKGAAAAKKAVAKVAAKPAAKKTAKKKVAKAPKKAGRVSKDAGKQLTATTAAKKSRIKASGLLARGRGHVVARGRRAQGKRDSRG